MHNQHAAQHPSQKKSFSRKKEMSVFIREITKNVTEQVTKQMFAKFGPVIKRQIKPDFKVPGADKQIIATFANQLISKVSGNADSSSDDSTAGNSSSSSSVPSSESST